MMNYSPISKKTCNIMVHVSLFVNKNTNITVHNAPFLVFQTTIVIIVK